MIKSLTIVAVVVGSIVAIGGGPIAWAILVIAGLPLGLLFLLGSAGHESATHPHFAPPRTDHRGD
jgi:hypothetical protein